MAEFIPATKRQLWALYCATHKDYRNMNISKEEASDMIKELSKGYVKSNKSSKGKPAKVSLTDELVQYITDNFDAVFSHAYKSLKHRSVVVDNINNKKYAFVGVGCGITYLEYRKNNKKAQEINAAANKFHLDGALKLFLSKFNDTEYEYFKNIGNPLEALWCQDQGMQQSYYRMVTEFAESKGVKMTMRSVLD